MSQGLNVNKHSYHHGDLRAALVEAGLELTRTDGPDGLSIRETTRRVGVSANAAYRHFADRDALLRAVSEAIHDLMLERMQPARPRGGNPASRARGRLRAVGLGYIRFALAEPGWFTVAFFGAPSTAPPGRPAPPYVALVEALDDMVAAGALTPAERKDAAWPCWSAVHGFAELALHGPLRQKDPQLIEQIAARTVDAIIAGLSRARTR